MSVKKIIMIDIIRIYLLEKTFLCGLISLMNFEGKHYRNIYYMRRILYDK